MRFSRIGAAFLTALLLVGACATHALHTFERPDSSANTVIWVMMADDLPGNAIGLSMPFVAQPQLIQIQDNMDANKTLRVVAHELLHAAGFKAHVPEGSEDCYFNPTADSAPLGPPCDAEVRKIRMVKRTFTVAAVDPRAQVACLWAVAMWNRAAGREVFVIGW